MDPMTAIHQAVLETVTYADIFDQPLSIREIHRYLHGRKASISELERALGSSHSLIRSGGWFLLPGREELVALRQERERCAAGIWSAAVRFGAVIAHLPFVRMVGLTGALAVRNADQGADVDYLVVAANGRTWTCRLFVVALVKWAARQGIVLCPNYFLAENALALADRSIFTAHELAQMVPLSGKKVYETMRAANSWADELLPNATGSPEPDLLLERASVLRRTSEFALRGRAGAWLEKWEMDRKISKFKGAHTFSEETQFNADRVQGHFNSYRAKTLAEFNRRLNILTEES